MQATNEIEVRPTTDVEYLRRWMLHPAFVRKMGGDPKSPQIAKAFDELVTSDARFFAVSVRQIDKGCIIFKRIVGGWELHLCLATWFTTTREALKCALRALGVTSGVVVAKYPVPRRAVDRLLDDVGFTVGRFDGHFRVRDFHLKPIH